jgi:uncharacterized membrane protein YhaH (DUF805 family)
LLVGITLLTVAGFAPPRRSSFSCFVIVFIPWPLRGFAFHTERLHDRGKSLWWLMMFYAMPRVLDHLAKDA